MKFNQKYFLKYEDNLLVVFLIDKSRDGYYAIAWVGDNVEDEINLMFGNEYTEFGKVTTRSIASNYEHSLGKNLALRE